MLRTPALLPLMFVLVSQARAGDTVIYHGDFDVNGVEEVASVDLETGLRTVLPLLGMSGGGGIDDVAVSPDRNQIVAAGLDSTGTVPIIALYPADGSGLPSILYSGSATDNFADLTWSPDGKWIAFRADLEINGAQALFVLPEDGSTAPKRVSQPSIDSSQDVSVYTWASNSMEIAFGGDLVTPSVNGLWTVDATAVLPAPVLVVANDFSSLLAYDGCDQLHFKSNHEGVLRLYRWDGVNATQVAGTSLLHTGGTLEAEIGSFGFSSDGLQLAFSSESPVADLYQVFVLPAGGGAATLVSGVQLAATDLELRGPNPFVSIEWSPDDAHLAVVADWDTGGVVNNEYSAFVLPTSGVPGGVRVMRASALNSDAIGVQFAGPSRLAVNGDLIVNNDTTMYATSDFTTADQALLPLELEVVPVGGDVREFETFLPGVHLSTCNGDGGDQLGCTNCPCSNNAPKGTIGGCLNSVLSSAKLQASGDTSASLPSGSTNDLRFSLAGVPPSAFCILNSGDALAPGNMANPCFGLNSGAQAAAFDGLRCAITNTRRHGGRSADLNGDVGVTSNPWGGEGGPPVGLAQAGGGFVSGQTRFFQVVHRDDAALSCMRGLNTSQAVGVTFTP